MESYGFIYIWRDKKHKKLYVGCHWGTEVDGYICSSTLMRNNYKNRPQDFRRKVVQRVYTNRRDLHEAEHRWLQLIKDEELGSKFYNRSKHRFGHWSETQDAAEIQRLIKETNGKKTPEELEAIRQKRRAAKVNRTPEQRQASLEKQLETKRKKVEAGWVDPRIGTNRSSEARAKMAEAANNRWSSEDEIQKQSERMKAICNEESWKARRSEAQKEYLRNHPEVLELKVAQLNRRSL